MSMSYYFYITVEQDSSGSFVLMHNQVTQLLSNTSGKSAGGRPM